MRPNSKTKWVSGPWTVEVIVIDFIERYKVSYEKYFYGECKSIEQLMYYLGTDYENLREVK